MRSKPAGLLRHKNGWRAFVDLAPDPVTGARRRHSKLFDSQKAAIAWRAEQIAAMERGLRADAGRMTVGEWLDQWVESSLAQREKSTILNHRWRIDRYIKPTLGKIRMRDLDSLAIARLYGSLSDTKTTRVQVSRTLHAALEEAVDMELLARNPARLRRNLRPKYVPVKGDAPYWTEPEACRFLDHVAHAEPIKPIRGRGFGFTAMYETCLVDLYAGLRLGELLGLEWDRVDLDEGLLLVDEQLTVEDGRLTLKPYLKGGRAGGRQGRRKQRQIHIERPAVETLARWRRIQLEERMAAGSKWQATHRLVPDGAEKPNAFVFTYTDGRPVNPQTFQDWFADVVAAAKVTALTPHGMRHSHTAILLRNGWQMHDVSARLGHAASTVTESTYAHIDTSRAPRAPRPLAEALAAHATRAAHGRPLAVVAKS